MRVCGLDEVGRGALAGPLVAAAVILNRTNKVSALNDSKKLQAKQRERIYREITESGAEVRIEMISVRQINSRGMGWANKEIFRRLIRQTEADKYIVDGNLKLGKIKGKSRKVKMVIKADTSRKCVMAAAITAKVVRDGYMRRLHEVHPDYGWQHNAGYGTSYHVAAIREHGETKHHRSVFVRTALSRSPDPDLPRKVV